MYLFKIKYKYFDYQLTNFTDKKCIKNSVKPENNYNKCLITI